MELMKTAEEMYMYCVKHQIGTGNAVKWSLGHFKVLEECLAEDEYAIVAYLTDHYTSEQKAELCYANAITNKRIIMGQQRSFEHRLKMVPLNELKDMVMTENNGTANLFVETDKGQFRMSLGTKEGENLKVLYTNILNQVKAKKKEAPAGTGTIEEIREYKKLMDEGVLTEEEFAEKKRQLLTAEVESNPSQEITLDIDVREYIPEKAEEVKAEFAVEKEAREYRSGRVGRIIERIGIVTVIIGVIYLIFFNPYN